VNAKETHNGSVKIKPSQHMQLNLMSKRLMVAVQYKQLLDAREIVQMDSIQHITGVINAPKIVINVADKMHVPNVNPISMDYLEVVFKIFAKMAPL